MLPSVPPVRYVPTSTFQKLVVALEHSRLDYGNSVFVGIPAHLMRRLQSVLNAAARAEIKILVRSTSDRTLTGNELNFDCF